MRDRKDNSVIVCSIENLDLMGVHTGDSITVAPAMTLTDREYQKPATWRSASSAPSAWTPAAATSSSRSTRRRPGHRDRDEPARLASTALASKATSFPIAKIAAKLAIGYTLDEIPNDITAGRPRRRASSDSRLRRGQGPALRLREVPRRRPTLTTRTKSVGEAMAIGRTFTEALLKGLRRSSQGTRGGRGRRGRRPRASPRCSRRSRRRPTAGCARSWTRSAPGMPQPSLRGDRHRPLVPRPAAADQRDRGRGSPGRRADRRRCCAGQAARLLRRPARRIRGATGRGPRRTARARHPPGVQDGRHLCRGVRRAHAVPLLDLRRGDRGAAARAPAGDHPGLGSQPDRPGHRVRLLLRARGLALAEAGYETIMVNCNPRRRSRPTTTPPTGSTSSRSPRGRARDRDAEQKAARWA